jgi:plastocyanin
MSLPRVIGGFGVALGLAVVGLAASGVGAAPESQQTIRVNMASNPTRFEPATITVAPGTMVVWETVSGSHTTTSETGLWDSGRRLAVGETFSYTFSAPGVYPYYCEPHRDQGMVGQVIVATGAKGM